MEVDLKLCGVELLLLNLSLLLDSEARLLFLKTFLQVAGFSLPLFVFLLFLLFELLLLFGRDWLWGEIFPNIMFHLFNLIGD